MLGVLSEHCSTDELSHLVAARRLAESQRAPRLSSAAAEELAEVLADGEQPTIGWWKRHLPPAKPLSDAWPSRQDVVAAVAGLVQGGVSVAKAGSAMRAELLDRGMACDTAEAWILGALR